MNGDGFVEDWGLLWLHFDYSGCILAVCCFSHRFGEILIIKI
jgi:hypothetical protein